MQHATRRAEKGGRWRREGGSATGPARPSHLCAAAVAGDAAAVDGRSGCGVERDGLSAASGIVLRPEPRGTAATLARRGLGAVELGAASNLADIAIGDGAGSGEDPAAQLCAAEARLRQVACRTGAQGRPGLDGARTGAASPKHTHPVLLTFVHGELWSSMASWLFACQSDCHCHLSVSPVAVSVTRRTVDLMISTGLSLSLNIYLYS